jgi:deoxyinosine 3'endonuclease (endonuclease V)
MFCSRVKLVAGLDISYPKEAHDKDESDAYAAVVICSFPSMEVVYEKVHESHLNVPYAPGERCFYL